MRNRWFLLALVAGLELCLSELPRQRAAADEPAAKKPTAETLLAAKRVRLNFKDTPVIDAVDELVRQSGYNIQIQGEVANLVKRKVTLDTGATSFWQAFDQLCRKAGLVEIASAPPKAEPLRDPRIRPGFRRAQGIRQFQLRGFPQPNDLQLPIMPGIIGAQGGLGGFGGKGGQLDLGKALGKAFQMPFGDGLPREADLQKLQQELQDQLIQMLEQMQKQLQQLQQGRPGQRQPQPFKLNQQAFKDILQQLQQMQIAGRRQLGGFRQPGLLGRPSAEPAEPEIRQINVKDGTPQEVPTCYAGAVRIRLLTAAAEGKRDKVAHFVVDVSVEPKIYSFHVTDASRVERAVDDAGHALAATLNPTGNSPAAGRGATAVRQPVIEIKTGDKQPKKVARLSGLLSGVLLAPSEPLIVVDDIFNAPGKTAKGEKGGSIEVLAVDKKGDGEVQVQIRLESPPALADGSRAASVPTLVDAKGDSYQLVQIPSRSRRSNGRVITQELTLLYRANPGQGDPAKMILNGVRPVTVEVPFAVQNVLLP